MTAKKAVIKQPEPEPLLTTILNNIQAEQAALRIDQNHMKDDIQEVKVSIVAKLENGIEKEVATISKRLETYIKDRADGTKRAQAHELEVKKMMLDDKKDRRKNRRLMLVWAGGFLLALLGAAAELADKIDVLPWL